MINFVLLSKSLSSIWIYLAQQVLHEIEEKAELILDERGKLSLTVLSLLKYYSSEVVLLDRWKHCNTPYFMMMPNLCGLTILLFFLLVSAEHERMVEAYALMDQKLQQALLEHDNFENTIRNLKVYSMLVLYVDKFHRIRFNIHIIFSLSWKGGNVIIVWHRRK